MRNGKWEREMGIGKLGNGKWDMGKREMKNGKLEFGKWKLGNKK